MALSAPKAVKVLFEQVMEQTEEQQQMAKKVGHFNMTGASAQNGNNVAWRSVAQQRPEREGWEFADSDFGDIIQQSYPATLGLPKNDLFQLRVDDFRDESFMKQAARAGAAKLASAQNQRIAQLVRDTGSLFYRAPAGTNGFDFVKQADVILSERQAERSMGQSFFANDRTALNIASNLANRQTLDRQPERAYMKGLIAPETAGFDSYESSFLPTLPGGASPAGITVTTTVSQGPVGNQVVNGITLPADYRISDPITLTGTITGLNVGDRISFAGVNSVGLMDKINTGTPMTFVIRSIAGQTIQVYPRPIAVNDAALTPERRAYANIATQITSGTALTRLNIDTLAQTNAFWVNDSIEIVDGDVPMEALGQFDGMDVISDRLSSGTKVYMLYQASINNVSLKTRLFTWYDVVNRDPSRNGLAILASS